MSMNKTPKNRGSSPTKSNTMKAQNSQQQQEQAEYVVLDKDLVRGLSEKEVEIEHLKTTIVALQEKVVIIDDMKQDVITHKQILAHSEQKREELQVHITQTSITIHEDTSKHDSYQQSLIEETKKLQDEIQRLKQHQAKREQEHLSKLEDIQQAHAFRIDQLNREHHDKLEAERREKEQMRQQKDQQIKNLEQEKEQQRDHYERKINELDQIIKQQQRTILQLNSTIIELKEIITQKSDVEDQLHKTREHLAQIDAQKLQLQKELETASDYILQLEEKVYRANKTSLELLRQLKDAEVEIETLKNYIIELKQRIAVYIPVKDDVIDKKLAEFINNYPERQKLKIMFMRESEGVYQFGTKRVAVRVDKDKINIRVGGGYLSIDEFLDQYTPGELEKLERKDPLKKFSEKIAIQKTIVGKEVRESSPIRGGQSPSQSSPTRRQ